LTWSKRNWQVQRVPCSCQSTKTCPHNRQWWCCLVQKRLDKRALPSTPA
jgi:hypothetical protein